MYGRKQKTRLPHMPAHNPPSQEKIIEEAREREIKQKEKQKYYKDKKSNVRHHNLNVGDTVLLSQRKTKVTPPYDPEPFTVIELKGHQITARRGEKTITRDAQKWKKFTPRIKPDYKTLRENLEEDYSDSNSDLDWESSPAADESMASTPESTANSQGESNERTAVESSPPRRYPIRTRTAIDRFTYDKLGR